VDKTDFDNSSLLQTHYRDDTNEREGSKVIKTLNPEGIMNRRVFSVPPYEDVAVKKKGFSSERY